MCRRWLLIPVSLLVFCPHSTGKVDAGDAVKAAPGPAGERPRLVVQVGHACRVTSVAFFPDGEQVLTASDDKAVLVWDTASGKELRRFEGHDDPVTSVAIFRDGRYVLTGSDDKTARLWDAKSGKELRRFTGHTGPVWSVGIAPDGRHVVTASEDRTARLWDAKTGKEVRRYQGHTGEVRAVTFSPDGKRVLTGSADCTARLWDAESGKELRRFSGHAYGITSVAFSPDGKRLLTGSGDPGAREPSARQQPSKLFVKGTKISPAPVPAVSGSPTARLWDADSGKELSLLQGHNAPITSVAFAPDGKRLLTGGEDGTARLWSSGTGKELRCLRSNPGSVNAVAFSSDGRSLLTGHEDQSARLWDADSGQERREFVGRGLEVLALAVSHNGQRLVTGSRRQTAQLWDTTSGKELRRLGGDGVPVAHIDPAKAKAYKELRHLGGGGVPLGEMSVPLPAKPLPKPVKTKVGQLGDEDSDPQSKPSSLSGSLVRAVALSADGKRLLTGSPNGAQMWDADSGRPLKSFAYGGPITTLAFSGDGKGLLTGTREGGWRLWGSDSGKLLQSSLLPSRPGSSPVASVALSADGKRLLTGLRDGTARLWDARTGKGLQHLKGRGGPVNSVAFSPDGRRLLTGSADGMARLWDAEGKLLRSFAGHRLNVRSVAFAPDGKRVLTGSDDFTARLWDTGSGKELRRLQGHGDLITSVAFCRDGKYVLTGSWDQTARLWDAESGKELCKMVSFTDGTWAAVDPAGRYDASNGGDVEGLHWVVGNEPIALAQLKERYYEPGLLAKYLGFNKEPLREVESFAAPKLYPDVRLTAPLKGQTTVGVTLTNRGGGIGRVVVLVNGKELTADARAPGQDPDARSLQLEIDLANDPRLRPGEKNRIEVQAYNAEGYLRSRGFEVEAVAPGPRRIDPPELWAVVAGVSDYRGAGLKLRYAAKDAEDFARAVRLAGDRLFGAARVHLTLLSTSPGEKEPTRDNLVAALGAAGKARPADVLVVYLAGHGVSHGGQDGDFYFLTRDARGASLTDPAVRQQVALSSAELTELLKRVPAQRQVLVLDTCASGRLIEKLTEKRDVPSSQIRALERVKDRTGMHILAGCAADAVSYEATGYAQGLLTHSLLLGMRGAALKEDQVDVGTLFRFAEDQVPELARGIGGIQRPVVAAPKGGQSFPIGLLTAKDRELIPLQAARPMVQRCSLQDEVKIRDTLGLTRLVNDRLREASAVGRGAGLVFVDTAEFPGAYELAGRYRVKGDAVSVTMTLFRGEKEVASFTVAGGRARLEALAAAITRDLEKRLSAGR